MINIKFKQCCHSCTEIKTYVDQIPLYADGGICEVSSVIGCDHEKVCKQYIEEKEATK